MSSKAGNIYRWLEKGRRRNNRNCYVNECSIVKRTIDNERIVPGTKNDKAESATRNRVQRSFWINSTLCEKKNKEAKLEAFYSEKGLTSLYEEDKG